MSKYATAASRALLSDEKCHPGTYVKPLDVVPTLARHVFRVRSGHISESGKDLNPRFKLTSKSEIVRVANCYGFHLQEDPTHGQAEGLQHILKRQDAKTSHDNAQVQHILRRKAANTTQANNF